MRFTDPQKAEGWMVSGALIFGFGIGTLLVMCTHPCLVSSCLSQSLTQKRQLWQNDDEVTTVDEDEEMDEDGDDEVRTCLHKCVSYFKCSCENTIRWTRMEMMRCACGWVVRVCMCELFFLI